MKSEVKGTATSKRLENTAFEGRACLSVNCMDPYNARQDDKENAA
jgi:hypothetical protein